MNSKLDQYFKEEIDSQDAMDVILDENSYVDYLISKRDVVDAVEYDDDDDYIKDDEDMILSDLDDQELDALADDDDSYINTLVD